MKKNQWTNIYAVRHCVGVYDLLAKIKQQSGHATPDTGKTAQEMLDVGDHVLNDEKYWRMETSALQGLRVDLAELLNECRVSETVKP